MTVCDYCGTEKPEDEMATMTFKDMGVSPHPMRFCSVECMVAWFKADTERMWNE